MKENLADKFIEIGIAFETNISRIFCCFDEVISEYTSKRGMIFEINAKALAIWELLGEASKEAK